MTLVLVACINCKHLDDCGRCEKHCYVKWYGCEEFEPLEVDG